VSRDTEAIAPESATSLPPQQKRVQRSRLSSQIANMMRTEVLAGRLKPGERVGQVQWAERVGSSRMPVRDAINQLCAEGILLQAENGSTTVAEVRLDDLADAWAANATIAGMAARRAAQRIQPEELQQLERLESELEQAIAQGDIAEAGRKNWTFHVTVNRAARSPQLTALLRSMSRMLSPANFRLMEDWSTRAPHEHRALLKAFGDGDGDRAMELMQAHVEAGYRPTLEMMQRESRFSGGALAADAH
jgi:DNA-binding GntR family transcriptional regulator